MSVCVLVYYASFTSSLFVLTIDGVSNLDILLAVLIIIFIGFPIPMIGARIYLRWRKVQRQILKANLPTERNYFIREAIKGAETDLELPARSIEREPPDFSGWQEGTEDSAA